MWNNNGFGGGCCWIIILIIILFCCCGNGNSCGSSCGCGCNCGCNNNIITWLYDFGQSHQLLECSLHMEFVYLIDYLYN